MSRDGISPPAAWAAFQYAETPVISGMDADPTIRSASLVVSVYVETGESNEVAQEHTKATQFAVLYSASLQ